jgi:glutamine amidotransferase
MRRLQTTGFDEAVPRLSQPVLGICLGMQLLFKRSEENGARGLGVLPDTVQRLHAEPGRPVPHMGWNRLRRLRHDPLLEGIGDDDYLYFVHSYAAPVSNSTLASTDYGAEFAAVVRYRNFWGAQFHPERSAKAGARLLANFLRLQ